MTGIDLIDTIVVHTVDKGTKVVHESVKPLNFAGHEFKKYEKKRRKLASGFSLVSSKGTKRIPLSKLVETQIPSLDGLYMSTGRGTGLRIG